MARKLKKMQVRNVSVGDPQWREMKKYALENHISVAALVRLAVTDYLRRAARQGA